MDSVADWIDAKPPRGNYTFTREEVVEAFPRMKLETLKALKRGGIGKGTKYYVVSIPENVEL